LREEILDSLERFWSIVGEVWSYGVLGISLGRVIVAAGILLLALAARRLFIRFFAARLRALGRRTRLEIDDAAVAALEQPLGLVPVVFGLFLASEFLGLTGSLELFSTNLIKSLVIVTIFWGFYRLVDPFSFLLRDLARVFSPEMVSWLLKGIKIAFLFIGAAAILQTWGIQVAPLLAGLGIFGVAVALGAQDVFKNLIAGLMIIAEKRFGEGDWIKVDGIVEGTVEKIGFRSTRVRRFDQAPVQVPNSKLSDEALTNFSLMTHRRIYWTIGVEYRTTVDQLRRIRDEIEAYVIENEAFVDPSRASTFVRIDRFNDSSIDIMLYCFTETTKWGEWLAIKEALAYRIKEIVEDAGTGFAFPSRSLYVETLPSDKPEPFVPPEGRQRTAAAAETR
jgi:MscS family membrane protein